MISSGMDRFVGTLDRDAEIGHLRAGQSGESHAERTEVQPGHLLSLIANDECPVALPTFGRRPLETTITP